MKRRFKNKRNTGSQFSALKIPDTACFQRNGGGQKNPLKKRWKNCAHLPTEPKEEPKEKSTDELIDMLRNHDARTREKAIEILAGKKESAAIEPLMERLDDKDWILRIKTAKALENSGLSDEQIEWITEKLQTGKNWEARHGAALVLGMITNASAVDSLITALGDKRGEVRKAAAKALGKIRDENAVTPLIEALGDRDVLVQEEAAQAIGQLRVDSLEAIISIFQTSENWMERRGAVMALGETGKEEAVETLTDALKDENWFVRGTAALALEKIDSKYAVDELIDSLGDENRHVQENAARAIENIGMDKTQIQRVRMMYDSSENREARHGAAALLRRIRRHRKS